MQHAGGRQGFFQVASALRHRNYRIFWFGFLVSIIGYQVQTFAQGYLVYDMTGSALNLGLISGSQAASQISFSLLGGVIADRVERRRLLFFTQVGGFACSFSLATLVLTDTVQVWHIALIAFVFGCFQAFDQPTRTALVPQLVDRSDLMNATALTSVVWQGSAIIGPMIFAIIVAIGGNTAPFYFAAAGFLAFFLALSVISVRPEARRVDEEGRSQLAQIVDDLGAGLGYIKRNRLFRALIGMAFFNAIFGLSFFVLLPVFAEDELNAGKEGLGALGSALGIGSLAGTLVVAALGDFPKKGLLIIGGACVFGALLIVFAFSPWLLLSLGLLVLIGITRSLYMTSSMTLLQFRLDDAYRGRVTAVYGLQWSFVPLGGLISGALADVWGADVAVAFGGAAVIAFTLLVGLRQAEMRQLDSEPAAATTEDREPAAANA
jgi:MFS family permease